MKIAELDTKTLFIGTTNVRKSPGDVGDLVESVREKGVLEPLIVRPSGKRYEVIVGSRRLEASRIVGLKKVPAVVAEFADDEAVAISLMENVQREAIDPEEEYDAFQKLMEIGSRFSRPKYQSEEELAKVVGKSRTHVHEVIKAVEVIRGIRSKVKTDISVKNAPSAAERSKGVLPISQASMLREAEKSQFVQELPPKQRAKRLEQLAGTIAPLSKDKAEKVVEHFVMNPVRPIEKVKEEAFIAHVSSLTVSLEPRVADALRKAAVDKGTTMESLGAMAIEVWLKGWKYI
jgi:ParB/RepB/Spo0J family partition protein